MFERYTEQARRAIYFARFEAIFRAQPEITPTTLLLGLTWDEDNRACTIWPLKDKVVDLCSLLQVPHRPTSATPYDLRVDIPLDLDSKKALAYAAIESNRGLQYWIDTDHLLCGILRVPCQATTSLELAGLSLRRARRASRLDRRRLRPLKTPYKLVINGILRRHVQPTLKAFALAILVGLAVFGIMRLLALIHP